MNSFLLPLAAAIAIVAPAHAEPPKPTPKTKTELNRLYLGTYKELFRIVDAIKDKPQAEKMATEAARLVSFMDKLDEEAEEAPPGDRKEAMKIDDEIFKYMTEIRPPVLDLAKRLEKVEYYDSADLKKGAVKLKDDANQIRYYILGEEINKFTTNYYKDPKPEEIGAFIKKEAEAMTLYFNADINSSKVGFFTEIFKKNSKKVPEWGKEILKLPRQVRDVFLLAMWQAQTEESLSLLKDVEDFQLPPEEKIRNMTGDGPVNLKELDKVQDPRRLDMAWGAFFASGDPGFVKSIMRAGARPDSADRWTQLTKESARWSVKALSEEHPKVREIMNSCLKELSEDQRREFRKTTERDDRGYSTT